MSAVLTDQVRAAVVAGRLAHMVRWGRRHAPAPGRGLPRTRCDISPVRDPALGFVVRITADRIGGVGPWTA
ncbi:MAG TPA: hypothetical protein VIC86_12035 [Acidimicrobiales bacterium]